MNPKCLRKIVFPEIHDYPRVETSKTSKKLAGESWQMFNLRTPKVFFSAPDTRVPDEFPAVSCSPFRGKKTTGKDPAPIDTHRVCSRRPNRGPKPSGCNLLLPCPSCFDRPGLGSGTQFLHLGPNSYIWDPIPTSGTQFLHLDRASCLKNPSTDMRFGTKRRARSCSLMVNRLIILQDERTTRSYAIVLPGICSVD